MAALHYYVHGNGRGHATRTLPVVRALRSAGHGVRLWAGGQAIDVLRQAGESPGAIESVLPGPAVPLRFARRMAEDRRRMRDRPALLVTDGDGPSMHAARSLGVPVVAAGHGLLFAYCELPLELSLTERAAEVVNARSAGWLAQRRVVSHFGALRPRDVHTVMARPDPRGLKRRDGEHLLVYGGRADLSPWITALHARGHRLRVFGRATALPGGLSVEAPDAESFADAQACAAGIVGTAGSNLVSEAAELGTALLALHPIALVEQRVNALLAEREGFAVAAPVEAVDAAALDRFEALLAQGPLGYRPPDVPTVSEAVCAAVAELLA